MKSVTSLFSPVVRGKVAALLAQARGVRASVILTRLAVLVGGVAGAGSLSVLLITLSGVVPGRGGVILAGVGGSVAAVCAACAALGPKMTEAAGLCRRAEADQVPFFRVLPQILAVLGSAPAIVRRAEAQALADARAAERQRSQDEERQQAQASHAALVTDVAAEVANLLRSSSFVSTAAGLVEGGILAPPRPPDAASPAGDGPP